MAEHAVAILMWHGPIIVRLPGTTPSQTTLDQIAVKYTARNCGVRPIVRVLEHLTIPAYENVPEPTCEELETGFTRGGRIEGQQRASLGRRI